MKQAPVLPIEIWKMIAGHLMTKDWARACGACRAMSQVQPSVLCMMPNDQDTRADLRWAMKRCSETEFLGLIIDNISSTDLADIILAGSKNLKHMQHLVLDVTPKDFDPQCPGLDENETPWLAEFLAQLTQLITLRLEAVRIDLTMLLLNTQLKGLHISFRLPFHTDSCHCLQSLHSLESLYLDVEFDSMADDQVVQISGLDLAVCKTLSNVHISMLEPSRLCVPAGCYVEVERDILWLDEGKWEGGVANHNGCLLRSNAYKDKDDLDHLCECPRLAGSLDWLSRVTLPHLTKLQLDYPKLCSADHPLLIEECLVSLEQLSVISKTVFIKFSGPARLWASRLMLRRTSTCMCRI